MNYTLLVMMLKDLVILPFQEIKLELVDKISKDIINISDKKYNSRVLVVYPNGHSECPSVDDLPAVGVVAYIKSKTNLANGSMRVTLKGEKRVKILNYKAYNDVIISANLTDIVLPKLESSEEKSLLTKLKDSVYEYIESDDSISNSIVKTIKDNNDLNFICDVITTFLPLEFNKKLMYMEEINYEKRALNLLQDIKLEIEYAKVDEKIDNAVHIKLTREQEEYYLKEKLIEIENKLGIKENNDIKKEYLDKLNHLDLNKSTYNKILEEIKRLSIMHDNSPELGNLKNYLDWVLTLPWNKQSKENLNVKSVTNSLNKSHYGLDKVKNKIIEYVNVKNINSDIASPIICLVGPPGVGKTTIASSIANSLNREFYKISVGGLNDVVELVGNRRSYLGALPGKIIQGLKKCGVNNPVILIDEVDKINRDYKGDPTSSLLDILDSTQNKTFVDNYIEEPFDLSNVLFILTANNLEDIPYTLQDRLDIIELSSYTIEEKVFITKKHIIPTIIDELNITKKVTIKDDVIRYIIDNYTKEAGVRNLTRLVRKIVINALTNKNSLNISIEDVVSYLDNKTYTKEIRQIKENGIVNALAYTSLGGTVLQIECSIYSGEDNIIVTGSLGNVLKESINVAISYIKEKEYVSNTMFYNHVIHIHLLENALKKEGPSCGVAVTTAILSKLLNIPVKSDVAFTGEISLKGRILKVGGLKEKLIAAYNDGIKIVYIPEENKNDLFEIPQSILDDLDIKFVSSYDSIYDEIFRKSEEQ